MTHWLRRPELCTTAQDTHFTWCACADTRDAAAVRIGMDAADVTHTQQPGPVGIRLAAIFSIKSGGCYRMTIP